MTEKDDSWRPKFIPRGYDKLDRNIYKRIFYSTSNDDSFRQPVSHATQPILHKMARSKSVQEIHDTNRGENFKPNRAPLYQRTMCAYTQQFVPRPLDGFEINKECYDLFKNKCESGNVGTVGDAESATATTTKESFPEYTYKEFRSAKPGNFKPKQAKHVSDEDKLLVVHSSSHRQFPCPSVENTRNARPPAFKPAIQRHEAIGGFNGNSTYSRTFEMKKYDSVWPVKFAGQSAPPPPSSGYTGKQGLDPNATHVLEPEQFRVGDVVQFGPC